MNIDFRSYRHTVDNDAIKHALKTHGTEATEKPRGQIPVEPADVEKIPAIITPPDNVRGGGKTDLGRETIVSEKQIAMFCTTSRKSAPGGANWQCRRCTSGRGRVGPVDPYVPVLPKAPRD